jgi:hypothetical protein
MFCISTVLYGLRFAITAHHGQNWNRSGFWQDIQA